MKHIIGVVFCFFSTYYAQAQFKSYGKQIIDTLASERYYGRGYVMKGDQKAATFIENELKRNALKPVNGSFTQEFGFTVNTFPGTMKVVFDGKELMPCKDFLVELYSTGVKGKFKIEKLSKRTLLKPKKLFKQQAKYEGKFILVDLSEFTEKEKKVVLQDIFQFKELASGILLFSKTRLVWGSSQYYTTLPIISLNNYDWLGVKEIEVDIENKYLDNYRTRNVFAMVPAKIQTDSFVVLTAHYDHLGMMGIGNVFTGANDNASGVSMVLALAKHLALKPLKYNVLVLFFAGEEMGLLGSRYFVEHPVVDLKKIKLLVNLDLVGTGDDGITVVNSVNNKEWFERLKQINASQSLLKEIKPRANAENSDHFPFTQKGVPAVFLYTLGGIQAYHDIYDRPETLPLTAYDNLCNLIVTALSSL